MALQLILFGNGAQVQHLLGLSEHLGIAAQVDFPLPSSFIWQLYQQLLPDVPSESPYNKANLAWKLFAIYQTALMSRCTYR